MCQGIRRLFITAALALLVTVGGGLAHAAVPERSYTVTQKFWKATVAGVSTIAVTNLPADLVAYEGDTVVITVRNESPIPEGFSIDAYNVHRVIPSQRTQTFRIVGVRAGAFVIYCQLHPYSVHYPGTLLVLPRR